MLIKESKGACNEQKTTTPPLQRSLTDSQCYVAPIYKFVLTGGPCAGKTTSLDLLSTFFRDRGFLVYVVPEACTILQTGGAYFTDFHDQDVLSFQWQLLSLQMNLEDCFNSFAKNKNMPCVILCDRGTMDGSAYVTREQWEDLMSQHDLNSVTLRDTRYIAVFHLVTAAKGAESFYTLENNSARSETIEEARLVDDRTCRAWIGHPKLFVFDNSGDFEKKMERLIDTASTLCGVPRTIKATRRFLLRFPPSETDLRVPHETFEVQKIFLKPEDAEKTRDYSFVRCRTQHGISAYGMTTVRCLASGEMVHLKRILSAREYAYAVRYRSDTTRDVITQHRVCFLHLNQSIQVHVYKEPVALCNLAILHVQASDVEEQIQIPVYIDIQRELHESDPMYSAYKISVKKL